MRRMRAWTAGHYVAIIVPVLAAGFGIYYMVRHSGPANPGKETAVIKPSQYDRDAAEPSADRKIALAKDHERPRAGGTFEEREAARAERERKEREKPLKDPRRDTRKPSSASEESELDALVSADAAFAGSECPAIEYRGAGPQATKVTKGEWTAVMEQFHGAKHALLGALEKRRKDLPPATSKALEAQVRSLKIQRPPAPDEPDLSWRGIGVYTQNSEGEPIVKLGGGFVRLVTRHPARARFEMARLVAQSLAPCELKRLGAHEATWDPLLKCLNVNDKQGCGQGSYSEAGWAVSTTLAAAVAPPGCQIGAFRAPEALQCMKRVPLSTAMAQGEGDGASRGVASTAAAPAAAAHAAPVPAAAGAHAPASLAAPGAPASSSAPSAPKASAHPAHEGAH
jgi:hypothetical protein